MSSGFHRHKIFPILDISSKTFVAKRVILYLCSELVVNIMLNFETLLGTFGRKKHKTDTAES